MCKDTGVLPTRLSAAGLAFAIVYLGNAIHYGWSPSSRTVVDDVLAWTTAITLGILYWTGYDIIRKTTSIPFRTIMLLALPAVLICAATIPYDSTDVFLYMNVGWAQAHYGLNPYTHSLRDVLSVETDPIIKREWMEPDKNPWLDLPFVYGFSFAWIVRIAGWLGRGNWWFTLGLMKLLNVGAYAATARLIWRISGSLEVVRPDIAVYLFAWSPLILQHHIANAHNDLLVGCLVIVSLYLIIARGDVFAPSVMILASLIKYATVPLIPLTLWFIGRRKGWPHALQAAVIAVLVTAAVSASYVSGIAEFRWDLIEAQLNKVTAGSLFAFIFYSYRMIAPGSLATFGLMLKITLWIVSGTLIVMEGVSLLRKDKPSAADFIASSAIIVFVVVFVASSQFYSWYIGMLFPLVLLLPASHWLRSFMVAAASTHVLSLTSLSRKGIGYFLFTTGLAIPLRDAARLR